MAAFFMVNAQALVLGEIQVESRLGQPLNARIPVDDLSVADAQQLKIRIAGIEDYKKLGLQYPVGHSFRLSLVNEPGGMPYISISSLRPLDDLFVNLLVETSQTSAKQVRAYTFLLDPPPNSPLVEIEQTGTSRPADAASVTDTKSVPAAESPARSARLPRKKHHAGNSKRSEKTIEGGVHRMKLTMSLSISSYDPSVPAGANRDALQEELISKQKALEDLKLQIGEMEGKIQALNHESDSENQVAAASEATPAEPPAAVVSVAQPSHQEFALSRLDAVLVALALLLAVTGLMLYRKRKQDQTQGVFDDLQEVPFAAAASIKMPHHVANGQAAMPHPVIEEIIQPVIEEIIPTTHPLPPVAPAEVGERPDVGERSMELPAYSAVVPPEYELLIEAKRHSRAGDDKQAEAALIRAVAINPRNSYGYLALLKIYEKRQDLTSFEGVARQLREAGDASTFAEAAVMGRRLDPENPLYAG